MWRTDVPKEETMKMTAAAMKMRLRPYRSLHVPAIKAPTRHPISALLMAHACMTAWELIPKKLS